jgi:hypothetical protein
MILLHLILLLCSTGMPAVTAFNQFTLAIYTPKVENYRIISLKEDWTYEAKTKEQYAEYSDPPANIKKSRKPHVLTAVLEFGDDLNTRAFWIDLQPVGSPARHMLKVSLPRWQHN